VIEGAAAAILVGGRATRLGGVVKAHLRVGGERILDRQLAVLRPRFAAIALVAGDPAPFGADGLPIVSGEPPGAGPLGALAAALAWSPEERLFVVAGDMPYLDGGVVDLLCARAAGPGADAAVPYVRTLPDPLHAVYRRACLPAIERRLAAGAFKVADLLGEIAVARVSEAELRARAPELRFLVNVNAPSDLP
jgi:molybdopterin-guanine dinucleotide biosynthesis protein A